MISYPWPVHQAYYYDFLAGILPGFLFPYAGISGRLPGIFIRLPVLLAASPETLSRLPDLLALAGFVIQKIIFLIFFENRVPPFSQFLPCGGKNLNHAHR